MQLFCHLTGKPGKLNNDPDYVPSIFVYSDRATATTSGKVSRCKHSGSCESNNELLQNLETMEQTILSPQELIAKLNFLLSAKQQHHTIAESNATSALQTQM